MIQANELRIGNVTKEGIIKNFWERGVHVGFGKCYEFSELEPIPLTEQILLKCGFRQNKFSEKLIYFLSIPNLKTEIHCEFFRGAFVVELNNHLVPIITEAENLHDLQNLYFSLCKQELQINL
jgi:hypothetical protein